jgi:hypothetical protein
LAPTGGTAAETKGSNNRTSNASDPLKRSRTKKIPVDAENKNGSPKKEGNSHRTGHGSATLSPLKRSNFY